METQSHVSELEGCSCIIHLINQAHQLGHSPEDDEHGMEERISGHEEGLEVGASDFTTSRNDSGASLPRFAYERIDARSAHQAGMKACTAIELLPNVASNCFILVPLCASVAAHT